MRTWLTTTLCLLCAGCAATLGYDRYLDRWVGASATSLIHDWGAPDSVEDAPGGGNAYTWGAAKDSFPYVHRNPYGRGPARTYWCQTTFVADKTGTVKTWRWDGNNCRSR